MCYLYRIPIQVAHIHFHQDHLCVHLCAHMGDLGLYMLIWPLSVHAWKHRRFALVSLCVQPYVCIGAHKAISPMCAYRCVHLCAHIDVCTYVCAYDMHMMFTCVRTRAHTCSHHVHIMCTPCAHLCVSTYAQPYAHMYEHSCCTACIQPI